MMKNFLKYLMYCHRPRVLSVIVALLHFVCSIRDIWYIYKNFLDYYSAEDLDVETDEVFDMPVEAVRYMLILFVLVMATSVMLLIGIILKRPFYIACFMLSTAIFIITFTIFAICDVFDGLLEGQPVSRILREFMNDLTLIVLDFLTLYPVFLVFVDLTEPLETSMDEPNEVNTIRIRNAAKTVQGVAV